ncbi:MAG: hypothetical protein GW763_11160 [Paraglaciecola sp.]|nr:hypothetical protein [Paraglaciecola sp.]
MCTQPPVKRYRLSLALFALLLPFCSSAKTSGLDWWFDIEVIVFKRDAGLADLAEKFAEHPLTAVPQADRDLLTPFLQPDLSYLRAGLDFCEASAQAKKLAEYEKGFVLPEPVDEVTQLDGSEENNQGSNSPQPSSKGQVASPARQDDFEFQVVSSDIFADGDTQQQGAEGSDESIQDPDNEVTQASNRDALLFVDWVEWQVPKRLPCVYQDQVALLQSPMTPRSPQPAPLSQLAAMPVIIDGIDRLDPSSAYLLPRQQLRLNDLYKSMTKQRNLAPLLHLGWRQEVKFGRDKAASYRLFAGQNFGQTYSTNGWRKASDAKHKDPLEQYQPSDLRHEAGYSLSQAESVIHHESYDQQGLTPQQANAMLFKSIHAALDDDSPLDFSQNSAALTSDLALQANESDLPLWQLDGFLKVFLQYVGRTPYLHIDTALDFREPVVMNVQNVLSDTTSKVVQLGGNITEANHLQSVKFSQFKRVISKQLHYFDHPLFGMVVIVNRYTWPDHIESDNLEQ